MKLETSVLSQRLADKVFPFRVAVPQPRQGRKMVAQGARSCENIVGGGGPLSRNAAILRVLPTAAETDYGHDIRLPFLGWGSWPLRLSFSLRLGLASGELSSGGGTIAGYCK